MRAVLAVLILLLAACTVPPRPAVSWRPCGDGLECATVTVPLDWSAPAGATIDLAVARFPAAGDRLGALFVNPGGPGRSGVEALRTRGRELAALGGDRFDVVSWDPRGSTITCTDACTAPDTELLAHVSSTASARDLDHLRTLVGEPQLTFYGESYGGFLGQVYANLFPARVRAMVLDGPPDPIAVAAGAEERLAASMTDARAVFGEFVRLCRAAGCPLTEQTLPDVLSATPIGALTYRDTLVATYSALQTPRRWPDLARGLAAAADGDSRLLLSLAPPVVAAEDGRGGNGRGDQLPGQPRPGVGVDGHGPAGPVPRTGSGVRPPVDVVAVGTVRVLAGARRPRLRRAVERGDAQPGAGRGDHAGSGDAVPRRRRGGPAAGQCDAVDPRGLRPPGGVRSQRLRHRDGAQLSVGSAGADDGVPRGPVAVPRLKVRAGPRNPPRSAG
ncbi:hypothetical protein BCA37_06580 [Mycobacterium sp. djl-10]|nr:hypothetical protein BCA37_06580 [Mycobacterium sp. djl-10]